MRPRTHNLISYSVAFLVFAGVGGILSAKSADLRVAGEPGIVAGCAMWSAHFLRRVAESAWVHRYGKPSMPPLDMGVEYVYYWTFAVWNAAALFAPGYRSPDMLLIVVGAVVFFAGEYGNAKSHLLLRNLRPSGTTQRGMPRGFLFERISCPHYFFEIVSWMGFAIATQTWAAFIMLIMSTVILGAWARTRHRAYQTEFDGRDGRARYPAGRRAMIPGIF